MKFLKKEYHSDNSLSSSDDVENSQNSLDISQQNARLVSLDGLHSGVPTRTTATLTPTTLRNIEQTFFDLTNDPPASSHNQAGFVPPLPSFKYEQEYQDQEQDHSLGSSGSSSNSSWQTPPPAISEEVISTAGSITSEHSIKQSKNKRNMGGRRPKNSSNLTPEEEAKRKIRRERNKLAAARCRKRRVDQTNELTDKVEVLERDRQRLQAEIQELQEIKEDLEFYLENHRAQCRLNLTATTTTNIDRKSPLEFKSPAAHNLAITVDKIKTEPIDTYIDGPPLPKRILLTSANPVIAAAPTIPSISGGHNINNNHMVSNVTISTRPNRPSSLNVPLTMTPSQALGINKNVADMAGVSITTPSTGVMFNFDSLMDGGTGLTPVSQPLMPNCSSQNKNPLDLATPTTESSKLVSL